MRREQITKKPRLHTVFPLFVIRLKTKLRSGGVACISVGFDDWELTEADIPLLEALGYTITKIKWERPDKLVFYVYWDQSRKACDIIKEYEKYHTACG